MRKAKINRETKEVTIETILSVDGSGKSEVKTGYAFFDHMLATFSKHSLFDIKVTATGDLQHHLIEDVAITLGLALQEALDDKKGIRRFASALIPMDDALARVVIDISGRPYAVIDLQLENELIEDVQSENFYHFLETFAFNSKTTINVAVLNGRNDHHKAEAVFKALAVACRKAVEIDQKQANVIPSAKGVL
jgi:imidazoleglycerol-phosphate dehydratase